MRAWHDRFAKLDQVFHGYRLNLLVLLTLVVFSAMVLIAGAQKSETIDEGLFIAGGSAQVEYANPNIDLSHPPLLRWLSGISGIYFGGVKVRGPVPFVPSGKMELGTYKVQDVFDFGTRFFYESGNDHNKALFWGRFPFVFLASLLGWVVFTSAFKHFGKGPALVSLLSVVFMPEILAHAQWAHADVASALTLFFVALALAKSLLKPSWISDALVGGTMGLAVATKLTALILWPLIFVMLAVFGWRGTGAFIKSCAICLGVFYMIVVVAYLPEPRLFVPHEFYLSDLARLGIAWFEPVLRVVPLPDTFLKGVIYTLLLGQRGQIAFLHGDVSSTGWWYYFPAAIFLKYPTGLLLAGMAGLVALWIGPWPRSLKAAFTFPPFAILFAAMLQSVNIGVRSILPIAPFLAVWSGVALCYWRSKAIRVLIVLLLTTSVLSGVFAYPNFLAYFNPLCGGTVAAGEWLVDSNLDWGQDLPGLAREMERRNIPVVRLAYFGAGRPSYYGIRALDPHVIAPGWYAISRSYLSGWWPPGDPYGWLRSFRPETLVGGSIALYHIDKAPPAKNEKETAGESVDTMMQAGLKALYEENDSTKAAALFREVLKRAPTHYGATFQLAMALDRAGRRDEARSLWKRVLTMAGGYHDTSTADIARSRLKRGQ